MWAGGHPSTRKGVTEFPGEVGECSSAGETGNAEGANAENVGKVPSNHLC